MALTTWNHATMVERIQALHAGDEAAWSAFVAHCSPIFRTIAQRVGVRDADIDDSVQESLMRAITRIQHADDGRRFSVWVRRMTYTIAYAYRKRYRHECPLRRDSKLVTSQTVLEPHELGQALRHAIAALTPAQQRAIHAWDARDFNRQAAAADLGIHPSTLAHYVQAACRQLRQALRPVWPSATYHWKAPRSSQHQWRMRSTRSRASIQSQQIMDKREHGNRNLPFGSTKILETRIV